MADGSHADVLIIGAGASGGVVARRLAEAGMAVVCLEQGDWPDRASFPGASPEWELRAAKQWSSVPSIRANPADYPLDLEASELGVVNFNGVGGGTVLYNAQWPRLLPDDLRVRTIDGVADDWPVTYEELAPYYERIDEQFGVSGLGGNPVYPPGADPPLPPLPIGEAGLRVARAHAELGWHWWPEPNAILSSDHDGRHRCVQRGTCGSGCNEGAKASTDLTHWPRVVAAGGRVVTGARVQRIVLDARGRALGAEWIDRSGAVHLQTADVTVCAANAIGTARLLLASACPGHPDGLANGSGLVGRRLMLHPLLSVVGLFEEQLQGWQAHAGGLVQCLEFARSDPSRGFVRGAKWALSSSTGPMRSVFPPFGADAWGADHHRGVRERLGRTASWAILVEDLPEEDNRVELSPTQTDGDGLPAPRLVYRVAENSRRNLAFQAERGRESLTAAGAWHVHVVHHGANGHFMGTTRMGDDPASSVVDRWHVSHEVPNLLVADGGVFVTAGAGNPTSTIAALALRAADHLVEARSGMARPDRRRVVGGFDGPGPSPVPTPVRREPDAPALDAGRREKLEAFADVLVPEADGMPAAGSVVRRQLDRVLAVRPDLRVPLAAAIDVVPDDADLAVLTDRETAVVRYVVAGAYYLDERVRERLGYPGTPARPVNPLDYPRYLEEGLLDHLL